jgi:hypothetical protein
LPTTLPTSSRDNAIDRRSEGAAELPRSEPEIIPPGVDFGPRPDGEIGFQPRRGIYIRVTRPGPLGVAAIAAAAGIVGALGILLLLGTLLVGALAAGVLIVTALLARFLARFRA